MRNLDLSPFWRSTVGFDRMFSLLDESLRWTGEDNYPPTISNGRARTPT
jgi:molecular chaperone IbpA